jgi:hypothetical protein
MVYCGTFPTFLHPISSAGRVQICNPIWWVGKKPIPRQHPPAIVRRLTFISEHRPPTNHTSSYNKGAIDRLNLKSAQYLVNDRSSCSFLYNHVIVCGELADCRRSRPLPFQTQLPILICACQRFHSRAFATLTPRRTF